MGWLQKVLGAGHGVGPNEAEELVSEGALLLDVREPSEWRAGHAPGARHLPLGDLGGRLDTLPRERRLVVACRSGNRSARATELLTRSGFDAVNLSGGMRAWAARGLPIERGQGQPGTVA